MFSRPSSGFFCECVLWACKKYFRNRSSHTFLRLVSIVFWLGAVVKLFDYTIVTSVFCVRFTKTPTFVPSIIFSTSGPMAYFLHRYVPFLVTCFTFKIVASAAGGSKYDPTKSNCNNSNPAWTVVTSALIVTYFCLFLVTRYQKNKIYY
jgi:hypothetical protein